MNVERIIALRHRIADLPQSRFNMAIYGGRDGEDDVSMLAIELDLDCGTAGCIAGWACALWAPDKPTSPLLAQRLLGLTDAQADALFHARGRDLQEYPFLSDVPPYVAIRTLDRLATTGDVSWR